MNQGHVLEEFRDDAELKCKGIGQVIRGFRWIKLKEKAMHYVKYINLMKLL